MGRRNREKSQDVPPYKQYLNRIESGDMWEAIQYLAGAEPSPQDEKYRTQSLNLCVEAATKGGPAALIDDLVAQILRFDARLLLRAQAMALRFEGHIDLDINRMAAQPNPRVTEELWLGRVARMEERILETAQIYARLQHVLALAKPKPKARPKIVYMNGPAAAQEINVGG